jgi:hypothetical protein
VAPRSASWAKIPCTNGILSVEEFESKKAALSERL